MSESDTEQKIIWNCQYVQTRYTYFMLYKYIKTI